MVVGRWIFSVIFFITDGMIIFSIVSGLVPGISGMFPVVVLMVVLVVFVVLQHQLLVVAARRGSPSKVIYNSVLLS